MVFALNTGSKKMVRVCLLSLTFFFLNSIGCTTPEKIAGVTLEPQSIKNLRGGLTEKEFTKVLHDNLQDIRSCYETEFKVSKSLRGQIVTRIKVTAVGIVSTKTEKNTTKSKTLSGCVNDAIESWKFPTSKDGKPTEISYPFNFEPF